MPVALARRHDHLAVLAGDAAREQPQHERADLVAARAGQHLLERQADLRRLDLEQPLRRGVGRRQRALLVDDRDAGADGLEHGLHQPPPLLQLLVLAHEAGARELDLLLAAREALRHAVEGGDQRAELVAARREVDARAALAGGDPLGPLADEAQRRRDAPREVEREPDRAEQDQQRREQVQRAVEREDRLAVGLRVAELGVALLHLARGRSQLGRQERRDHDAARGLAVRPAHRHRDAREAARAEGRRRGRLRAPERRLGERLARGRVPGRGRRQPRVHHRDDLAAAPVHRDEVELALPRARLDRPAQPRLVVAREQPAQLDLAREHARVHPARLGGRGVERAAERLRGGEQPLDVHVEPAVDRLPDQVAADQQHQQRRRDGHQQEHEQQLHAQPGAEDAAPPLHQHAHEVAAQHEQQHEQQRQVQDREPEQQHRGAEGRLEVPALAQQVLGEREHEQQPAGDGEHELHVVLEALPRHTASLSPGQSRASSSPLSVPMNWSTSLKSR